jgi:DNA repair photolyase
MEDEIDHNYGSPRWSQEVLDCSMPVSFDTYSRCSYNCLYCFSYYQKKLHCKGYAEGVVRSVNPAKVEALFTNSLSGNFAAVPNAYKTFSPYISARKIMQWGGLADQFDQYEKKYGVSLELMKYFSDIDYPLSFSTKAVWWTEDSRYMEIMQKHLHNWHVKVSIITLDKEKARHIELGCPKPDDRIKALKRLSDIGMHTTLRLRPIILGISSDWKALIQRAAEAGIDSVSSEFFCLETRDLKGLMKRDRYGRMSEVAGYDIHTFYREHSSQSGYLRLNYHMKYPLYAEMKDLCRDLGIRLHISDAHCRDLNEQCNCCGVPPEWNSQTGNFNNAIIIARKKGFVRFSDIAPDIEKIMNFSIAQAPGFNLSNNTNRALFRWTTFTEYFRYIWNSPEKGKGLAKMYGDILAPAGRDANGDIIYRYSRKSGR